VEIRCALMKYENEKAKPAHYLVQIVDLDNPKDQQQEWFSKQHELVSDPNWQEPSVFIIFTIKCGH